jgi:hypothetical protein
VDKHRKRRRSVTSDTAPVDNVGFSTETTNSSFACVGALGTVIHQMHTAYYYDEFLLIT